MTGERDQCQDCEEILIMPLEFDNNEDYLEFLKVQSPEKFTQMKEELKIVEKESEVPKNEPEDDDLESGPSNGKLSHICIFGDCTRGKKGGTDYCRKHK